MLFNHPDQGMEAFSLHPILLQKLLITKPRWFTILHLLFLVIMLECPFITSLLVGHPWLQVAPGRYFLVGQSYAILCYLLYNHIANTVMKIFNTAVVTATLILTTLHTKPQLSLHLHLLK